MFVILWGVRVKARLFEDRCNGGRSEGGRDRASREGGVKLDVASWLWNVSIFDW